MNHDKKKDAGNEILNNEQQHVHLGQEIIHKNEDNDEEEEIYETEQAVVSSAVAAAATPLNHHAEVPIISVATLSARCNVNLADLVNKNTESNEKDYDNADASPVINLPKRDKDDNIAATRIKTSIKNKETTFKLKKTKKTKERQNYLAVAALNDEEIAQNIDRSTSGSCQTNILDYCHKIETRSVTSRHQITKYPKYTNIKKYLDNLEARNSQLLDLIDACISLEKACLSFCKSRLSSTLTCTDKQNVLVGNELLSEVVLLLQNVDNVLDRIDMLRRLPYLSFDTFTYTFNETASIITEKHSDGSAIQKYWVLRIISTLTREGLSILDVFHQERYDSSRNMALGLEHNAILKRKGRKNLLAVNINLPYNYKEADNEDFSINRAAHAVQMLNNKRNDTVLAENKSIKTSAPSTKILLNWSRNVESILSSKILRRDIICSIIPSNHKNEAYIRVLLSIAECFEKNQSGQTTAQLSAFVRKQVKLQRDNLTNRESDRLINATKYFSLANSWDNISLKVLKYAIIFHSMLLLYNPQFSVISLLLCILTTLLMKCICQSDQCYHPSIPSLPSNCLPFGNIKDKIVNNLCANKSSSFTMIISYLMFRPKLYPSNVVIHGPHGAGKSTLASIIIHDKMVKRCYRESIGWITLGQDNLDYAKLINLYSILCAQVLSDPSQERASFLLQAHSLMKDDEMDSHLPYMAEMQNEIANLLYSEKKNILVVLDNICNKNDISWFTFDKSNTCWKNIRLLITTSDSNHLFEVANNGLKFAYIRICSLEEKEVLAILLTTSTHLHDTLTMTSDATKTIVMACVTLPPILRLIIGKIEKFSRQISKQCILNPSSSSHKICFIFSSWWNELSVLLSSLSDCDQTVKYSSVVDFCIDSLSTDAQVAKQYLAGFESVFTANMVQDPPLLHHSIPLGVIRRFLGEIKKNKNSTNLQTLKLKQAVLRLSTTTVSDASSHSDLSLSYLKDLGLMQFKEGGQFVLSESSTYCCALYSSSIISFSQDKHFWNSFLVNSYKESVHDCNVTWTSHFTDDEYTLKRLPLHMVRSKMLRETAKLLDDKSFIMSRILTFGYAQASHLHINDVDNMMKSFNDGATKECSLEPFIVSSFHHFAKFLIREDDYQYSCKAWKTNGHLVIGLCLFGFGHSLQKYSLIDEGLALFEAALKVLKRADMKNTCLSSLLCHIHYRIGICHEMGGKEFDSVLSYTKALQFSKISHSKMNHVRVLQKLGTIYLHQKNYAGSLNAFEDVLKIQRISCGINENAQLRTMESIGSIHCEMGNFVTALELYEKAMNEMSVRKKNISLVLQQVGKIQYQMGELDKAISSFIQSLELRENCQSLQCADCLFDLGLTYRLKSKFDNAIESYDKALQIYKLNDNKLREAETLELIGIVHCDCIQYDLALKAFAESIRIRKITSGNENIDLCNSFHNMGIVKNNTQSYGATKAFTDALWAEKALSFGAPSKASIRQRCIDLFGSAVWTVPCVASRILSCVSLVVDMISKEPPTLQANGVPKWLLPFIPLLKAYVDAEIAAMEEDLDRTINFCVFDFSSISFPVDMEIGSNHQLETMITSLSKVLRQMRVILSANHFSDSKIEIAKILLALHCIAAPLEGEMLRKACAETMPTRNGMEWPQSRFITAAEFYRAEFEVFVTLLESGSEVPSVHGVILSNPLTQRLGTLCGSAVRFHLRRLFDPPPEAYTIHHDLNHIKDFSDCRAETFEIVAMCSSDDLPANESKCTLWDSAISYVFSLALRYIYAYVQFYNKDNSNNLTDGNVLKDMSNITSNISLISSLENVLHGAIDFSALSAREIRAIIGDIYASYNSITATQAADFILDLFSFPGVLCAIQKAGGWTDIERISGTIVEHHLDVHCENEAHFALLSDVEYFIHQLTSNQMSMTATSVSSRAALDNITKCLQKVTEQGDCGDIVNDNVRHLLAALYDGKSLSPEFPDVIELLPDET